jgi:hypothetical protein
LVEVDSSQISGRNADATRSSTGATSTAVPSARWSASRLGTSSLNTIDR